MSFAAPWVLLTLAALPLLLGAWRPLPFLVAAAAVVAVSLALVPIFGLESDCPNRTLPYERGGIRELLRDAEMREFAAANAFWEFSFSGLKSFIVLYVVRGLGHSPAVASAACPAVSPAGGPAVTPAHPPSRCT